MESVSWQSGSVTGKSAPQLQSQAAGSILSSGLSVRSQCHKTTLYKRHEIIRLPTRLAAAWQAKQPAESGRKRKAALCLLGSPRQALHPQGLGVQHSGLPGSIELDHDDGRQENEVNRRISRDATGTEKLRRRVEQMHEIMDGQSKKPRYSSESPWFSEDYIGWIKG